MDQTGQKPKRSREPTNVTTAEQLKLERIVRVTRHVICSQKPNEELLLEELSSPLSREIYGSQLTAQSSGYLSLLVKDTCHQIAQRLIELTLKAATRQATSRSSRRGRTPSNTTQQPKK